MPASLLDPEIQQFISAHIGSDLVKLALQKNPFPEVDWIAILNQISAKTKAKEKLPTWFQNPNILYPSKISVAQTSSEKTAAYKAGLVSGKTLIDLTGGFGVDDYYFAKRMEKVIHCELNAELSEIAAHNFRELQIENIACIAGDSSETLKNLNSKFDWIYIDPSRRNEAKGKVFMLKDCLPNVPDLLDLYLNYSENILVKTAPILDIAAGLSELRYVTKIHIVAVENEVKELLWEIKKGYSDAIEIATVNFLKDNRETFNFKSETNGVTATLSLPLTYLFEPNAAIMKSGRFDEIGIAFGLEKLHRHSHLYTSEQLVDFPGRIFEIQRVVAYQKSEMKTFVENQKANVTVRNFPETVEAIRKKWKIKDGGDRYCFFTTDKNDNKIVLICTKIK